jgi:tetratricopeptide (TPR) repeat protein
LRYQSAAEIRTDLQRLRRDTEPAPAPVTTAKAESKPFTQSGHFRWLVVAGAAILTVALVLGGWLLHSRKEHALTDKDTIVLADFANTTGDPVFDDTLRQGLAVQLEQSPFLSLVSEDQIRQTLRTMGQPAGARLTPEMAREVCQQRTGGFLEHISSPAAILEGSIASLGRLYVVGLKAVNCHTGDSLAEEQATADGKEQVLRALGEAATKLRSKLGESLSTVEKFDTPLLQATTPSLEALQAFSLGVEQRRKGDHAAAVPLFQRAIALDPNFAVAYAVLGDAYQNLGEGSRAEENIGKAYELRQRVSQKENFFIESSYNWFVTGDLEKARQTNALWAQTYPRDGRPHAWLSWFYTAFGQYDKALEEIREAYRLDGSTVPIANAVLAHHYLLLNRLEEARSTAEQAQAKNLDSRPLHVDLYKLAFLQNDTGGMTQQATWATGKPGMEDVLLAVAASTAAYSGQLGKARDLYRRAVAAAERAKEQETAANYQAEAALLEALFGNAAEARKQAEAALGLSRDREVESLAGVALAFSGEAVHERVQTERLADELAKRFPEDTVVRFNYLPTIRGQVALSRNDPSKAFDALEAANPYKLGLPYNLYFSHALYPVYVLGQAFLAIHQGGRRRSGFSDDPRPSRCRVQ